MKLFVGVIFLATVVLTFSMVRRKREEMEAEGQAEASLNKYLQVMSSFPSPEQAEAALAFAQQQINDTDMGSQQINDTDMVSQENSRDSSEDDELDVPSIAESEYEDPRHILYSGPCDSLASWWAVSKRGLRAYHLQDTKSKEHWVCILYFTSEELGFECSPFIFAEFFGRVIETGMTAKMYFEGPRYNWEFRFGRMIHLPIGVQGEVSDSETEDYSDL